MVGQADHLRHQRRRATVGTAGAAAVAAVIILGGAGLNGHGRAPELAPVPTDLRSGADVRGTGVVLDDADPDTCTAYT